MFWKTLSSEIGWGAAHSKEGVLYAGNSVADPTTGIRSGTRSLLLFGVASGECACV